MTRSAASRQAIHDRSPGLLPPANNPIARGFWRGLCLSFWLLYFGFVIVVLALRYAILPNIENYRADIERLVSQNLGQPVSIGRIEASWAGINPDLALFDVRVADAQGRPALAFTRVEAIPSWWSLARLQLRLRVLRIDQPTLNLRRDPDGNLFVAGIQLGSAEGGGLVTGSAADWVLEQRRIRIRGAKLVWEDELRQAPPLVLEDVDFALDNDGRRHRFGLSASPPAQLAGRIDVRGDLRGADAEQLTRWSGQIYAEAGDADLAVWRQWIAYPLALPYGRGAARAWFELARGSLRDVTADLALRGTNLQLAADLPALELERMSGRLAAQFTATGFSVNGRGVELLARPFAMAGKELHAAVRVAPTDFHVDWDNGVPGWGAQGANQDATAGSGTINANRLDLGALAALAEHFPLAAGMRQRLSEHRPRGVVSELDARWTSRADAVQAYSLACAFTGLGMTASGSVPGFSGLSGQLKLSEQGGTATIQAGQSTVDLPAVFPVPRTELDSLLAQIGWVVKQGETEVKLAHAEFTSPDAAGSAQGSYRTAADGPGDVDFSAALTRADAKAVWRYMPHVVGEGARLWLRDSLLAGTSNEAKLVLRGNLADFPFLDPNKGEFLVTVKARDVVLDYAEGWPRIEGISGDLRFAGNGMVVDAQRGTLLGAKLAHTRAEIPDFDRPISTLIVKGQADGPTAEFLKFIDQSPVAERIDHFTDGLRASGNGHLDLKLVIPLDEAKLADSKIDGGYRFVDNEVSVDPALPAIRQVNGNVEFTGDDVRVPQIDGSLLGGPLTIKGGLQKDGKVLIATSGRVDMAQLRTQFDSPLLDQLSGSAPYQGEV
ncbi:MAG: DUF3971 domain-containing protein, partial [Propionivibrio sp.]